MSTDILQSLPQSPGVWKQAWLRLKTDRVGMVSLYITLLFIVLVLAAQLGLVAKDWQKEVAVPFAAPTLVGKIADGTQTAIVETVAGPNVDISDVDPLAPRYKEWDERAAQFKTTVTVKADTLPFGADQQSRRVQQGGQRRAGVHYGWADGRLVCDAHRDRSRGHWRLFRGTHRRFSGVGLQRIHRDSLYLAGVRAGGSAQVRATGKHSG